MLSVSEIMTREPYTLAPEASLADARRLMAEHHIRHVPILSPEGTLIGVVSQRDVLAGADSVLQPHDEEAVTMESRIRDQQYHKRILSRHIYKPDTSCFAPCPSRHLRFYGDPSAKLTRGALRVFLSIDNLSGWDGNAVFRQYRLCLEFLQIHNRNPSSCRRPVFVKVERA